MVIHSTKTEMTDETSEIFKNSDVFLVNFEKSGNHYSKEDLNVCQNLLDYPTGSIQQK